jgi:hypothetical protein
VLSYAFVMEVIGLYSSWLFVARSISGQMGEQLLDLSASRRASHFMIWGEMQMLDLT